MEVTQALARPDPPSNEDDVLVTGPKVFKMNISCEDEYILHLPLPREEEQHSTITSIPTTIPALRGINILSALLLPVD
jgi:hypothetical protein